MQSFFDINNMFFEVWGYEMSYLEFFGTIAGFIAVWLASKANIWSWPLGLINVTLFFFLFYQVQLYPDMFLQLFFFITNLMGWWRWTHPKPAEEDRKNDLKVSYMPVKHLILLSVVGLAGTFLFGSMASRLHEWFPVLFNKPSAFPFLDSFVTVMSIITTFLMIQKKIECWAIWILIDVVATYMYFMKGIKFVGFEYLVFCFIAGFGLWNWVKEYRSYSTAQ
ncbi:MAG: nicotinamide riboside transporter PnuC [Cyclobacteriaceae bacterium]|nr:nicotinamide riboside transporter PnuC [Cyclobacteriaceae bacterium]